MLGILKNNILGHTPLWQVFWIQIIFIGGLIELIMDRVTPYLPEIPLYLTMAVIAVYGLWIHIGMWQCAFNAKWVGWDYVTRMAYILIISLVILYLF